MTINNIFVSKQLYSFFWINNNDNTDAVLVPAHPILQKLMSNIRYKLICNMLILSFTFSLIVSLYSLDIMLHQLDVQKAHKPESWLYLRFFREAIGLEQLVNMSFSFDDSSTRFHQDIQSHPEQPLQQQCFPFCRKSRNALHPTDCRHSLHL